MRDYLLMSSRTIPTGTLPEYLLKHRICTNKMNTTTRSSTTTRREGGRGGVAWGFAVCGKNTEVVVVSVKGAYNVTKKKKKTWLPTLPT